MAALHLATLERGASSRLAGPSTPTQGATQRIESSDGAGSRGMPLAKLASVSSHGTRGASQSDAVRVLVVDDEPGLRRTLRVCLETDGFQVAEADEAGAALAVVRKERCDLVFVDLRLGQTNGLELIPK